MFISDITDDFWVRYYSQTGKDTITQTKFSIQLKTISVNLRPEKNTLVSGNAGN